MASERKRNRKKATAASKLKKVRVQADAFLEADQHYEALQLYRSLHTRFCNKKQPDQAILVALEGSRVLLEHKKFNAVADLGEQLIVSYTELACPPTSEQIDHILELFQFPVDSQTSAVSFMKKAIQWTVDQGDDSEGDSRLHLALAHYLQACNDFASAQRHFLRADSPAKHATMLLTWAHAGYPSEADLFVARSVLQYCCLEDLKCANNVLSEFVQRYNANSNRPIDTPLLNFTKFLLKVLERNAAPLYQLLRQKYRISLSRDPSFGSYLDKIGQVYFNVKPPPNMLENLLSFMGPAKSNN